MTSNMQQLIQEETLLTNYLVKQVCNRALGRSEFECLRNYPRDVYFIGNLRPSLENQLEISDNATYLNELINKLSPVAYGAEFCLHPLSDEVVIEVAAHWTCYYRIFPTRSQQLEHQKQQIVEVTGTDTEVAIERAEETSPTHDQPNISAASSAEEVEAPEALEDSTIVQEEERREQMAEIESPEVAESQADRRRKRIPKDSLFIRFRKVPCQAKGRIIMRRVTKSNGDDWSVDKTNLQLAIDQETLRAQQVVSQDALHIRAAGKPDDKVNVPENALESEETYQSFVQSLQTEVIPEWKWDVRPEVRQSDAISTGEYVLFTEFVNISPMSDRAPNTEAYFFDTTSTFTFRDSEVRPFEMDLAPRGFRYDRTLWGRGFNCAVERPDDLRSIFITTHTPIHSQQRYTTREQPQARFADLAQDPIPTLKAILCAMRSYRQEWGRAKQTYMSTRSDWQALFENEFDKDQQRFIDEIELFRRGCELIYNNADVLLAFQLTNETFRRLGDHPLPEKRKEYWRLFQIVFLVSQIPAIAALASPNTADLAEREMVDIIYFPTGGGKTEAYLGTIIFHCFFDRLRSKAAGVTAWTRFPLRLLTLQQTQRVADVIGTAEILRKEQKDSRLSGQSVDGFSVGYLVGAEGTPNEITDPAKYRYAQNNPHCLVLWSQATDTIARQRWKRIFRCPLCRTQSVSVDFDAKNVRVLHRCSQPNCAFPNGIIPVYVVDNEIYRYLPSVIVGTIDKLASIGNQRKLALIFGQVDGRCPEHGYYKKKCCQKDCQVQRLSAGIPRGLSGPTLFVQDELHLLKEGLGTFDAHYETFVQRLRQNFGLTASMKIIASSATIEAFERQIAHLYGRDTTKARVFPGHGPTSGQSFYAETLAHAQRLFVGLIPHNKTIFNTILELIDYYHREVQFLQRSPSGSPNPYGGSLQPGSSDWQQLLDYYITSLTYFLANRELNSIRTDLNGDVNPNLQRDGLAQLDIRELTGSTSTDDVTDILNYLEQPATSKSVADAVLATSMISHGVDIERFNAMVFYGMPRQSAEYIQASSRVGRSHIGIVFACLHPARERDQSHYTYFVKFHEFLGQLVEPVAINRWAKFSINRTLPGLFMGVLLQLFANSSNEKNPNKYYMLDFVKQKISNGELTANDFIPLLEQAYLVPPSNPIAEQDFRKEIRRLVRAFIDQIISGNGRYVSEVLIPKPMRSLRDVDETIDIELDSAGTQWADRM